MYPKKKHNLTNQEEGDVLDLLLEVIKTQNAMYAGLIALFCLVMITTALVFYLYINA